MYHININKENELYQIIYNEETSQELIEAVYETKQFVYVYTTFRIVTTLEENHSTKNEVFH